MASTDDPTPPAGGFLIAIGALGGTAVGIGFGQVTVGFLIGTTIGGVAAFAIWWRHRQR